MTEKIEKNKNKKIFAIIAIIAVIAAAAAVYGIIAYFTAKDSKTNTFVVGNVSIRLDEGESWAQIQANGGNLNLEPNQEITKEPKIINTGRNAAYVYLKVRIPKAKINANDVSKSPLFTYNQNTTDWDILEEDDQADYVERTYWYKGGNGILNAGAETGTLFDYVKLAFDNIKRLNDMYKTIKIDKFVMEHESSSATNSKYLRYSTILIFNVNKNV